MSNRSVISVHTKSETSQRLEELATLTRRSKSFLANKAIELYLAEEEAFVTSVRQGIADVAGGHLYSIDEIRQRLQLFVSEKASEQNGP
ncbi:MAG: hypothetical protein H6963_00130 [Chromatiaceae bacterium]|nr:hypothetical protein [Chromatiaceae bacterium]MCP5441693.1 hypothetical protein [Chromatiaceae bacterium]